MGPFNGGESVLGGFYLGDLVRLMYQLSSYYFLFYFLFEITMYFNVNSPYRLCSSNVTIGDSGEAIYQFLP